MKKKNLIISMICLLAVWCTGCDALFDDELPPHSLVGENAITNETSAETALNGIYSMLGQYGSLVAYYILDNEYRTGLMEEGYRGTFDKDGLLGFQLDEVNSYVLDPWKQAYRLVNRANNFIYYVEKLDDSQFGVNRKAEMLAEAYFMRAFGNMFLLRRYGYFWDVNSPYGIILRLEPASLSNNTQGRATVKACYEQTFKDLDYAIEHGPAHYSKFRSCAVLAKAFKADLLMNRGSEGDYAEALRLAEEVIGSGEFKLEEHYADVFTKGYTSEELMFSRFLKNPPEIDDNRPSLIEMLGSGNYKPNALYLNILTPEDKRYEVTFDSLVLDKGTDAKKKLIWKKHYVEDGDCPMYYMRLAQLYLIKAEAMLYTKAAWKDVVEVLNVLRRRSGNTLLRAEDYASEEELCEEIFNENLREIGMENGALYYLAVRMKRHGNRMLKMWNENYEKDDQLCFPVPLQEREHNPAIEQKPM